MTRDHCRRPIVVGLSLVAFFLHTGPPLAASDAARLPGRVVGADGVTPREGVVVALVSPADGARFTSSPSDGHGTFVVDSAPTGTYRLMVETPEGVFIAPTPLELAAGEHPGVALALKPAAQEDTGQQEADQQEEEGEGEGEVAGEEEPLPPPPPPEAGMKPLTKWVIAGSIIVGGLGAMAVITEEEDPTSPF